MGKASRRKRELRQHKPRMVFFDYHAAAFAGFHLHPAVTTLSREPHGARTNFWMLVPPGTYYGTQASELLRSYAAAVERELQNILEKHSIAYYLHLYRRLAPYSIGSNDSPATIGLVRATLEAAIQKYAKSDVCDRVGDSTSVPVTSILRGALARTVAEGIILDEVTSRAQLVLTAFGPEELAEFYATEKMAYEVWRTHALMRSVAKGSALVVGGTGHEVGDARTDEQDRLIVSFDERQGEYRASALGIVFSPEDSNKEGWLLTPTYNVEHRIWAEFDKFTEHFMNVSLSTPYSSSPNLLWLPFNIRGYYTAHKPFEREFHAVHGCSVADVVLVLASLLFRAVYMWRKHKSLPRHWLRGYDGPSKREIWLSEIEVFLPAARDIVSVGPIPLRPQIEAVFEYLSLTSTARDRIDVGLAGPHAVFLPCGENFFADYAWMTRHLYRLFHGLTQTDQNFKADLLENAVRSQATVLPTRECRAFDGTSKQFDASFEIGDTLIVVECKAKGWSLGFERGDIAAVEERTRHITEILRQIDEKAVWLASRPKGRNYDVRRFRYILPIGVSPFAEYIPRESSYWWLTEQLPRVMTPKELHIALRDGSLQRIAAHHALTMPVARVSQS